MVPTFLWGTLPPQKRNGKRALPGDLDIAIANGEWLLIGWGDEVVLIDHLLLLREGAGLSVFGSAKSGRRYLPFGQDPRKNMSSSDEFLDKPTKENNNLVC